MLTTRLRTTAPRGQLSEGATMSLITAVADSLDTLTTDAIPTVDAIAHAFAIACGC